MRLRVARMDELFPLREMATAVASEQETEHLLQVVMHNANRLLNAERSTLFLVDWERKQLWSKIAHGLEIGEIRMPMTTGIAGHVASTGELLNIADAHNDPRFNQEVDRHTGYRTQTILCMPLRDPRGHTVGVIEVLNKRDGAFTKQDEAELAELCSQAAILIHALMQTSSWSRTSR